MSEEKTKELKIIEKKYGYDSDDVATLVNTVAKGATLSELKVFAHQCKKSGLDPLAKQIYFVKRGDQATIQTGIDGYRAIADRTGKYAGSDDPIYDKDIKMPSGFHPQTATATVYKFVNGEKCSFTATARWSEYAPTGKQDFMWKKMPFLMLGKCAESLALRKAFPADLSGILTQDEMAQSGQDVVDIKRPEEKTDSKKEEMVKEDPEEAIFEEKKEETPAAKAMREGMEKVKEKK